MDLGGWLRSLGLDEYESTFRENGIDEHVLCHLTAEELRQIGVSAVGDRRRLLTAIGELIAPSLSMEPRLDVRPKTPVASAERRPIAVMFCDLVGSTGLATSLDVEDWRKLLGAYLDAASAAVSQMGGRVAKTLGDGLMALFGHPIAQENDSERAVRAALAIHRALAELRRNNAGPNQPELVARIGIESGAVVVDEAGEIFGDAPNVAARVQALAEPGTVMVTARVQSQVSGLFVAEDRGAHILQGASEPTTLFRIVRASGGRRAGARALTPLVGREKELALLRRQWDRARDGAGQFTFIVGEAGIGKSRLLEEFRATLGQTPHTWSEFLSSQLLQNTPLHPFAEWGRQRFGADEPAGRRLADLENTLRLIGLDPGEYAPLLAPLVDIPLPEERAMKLAPEELRRRQLAAATTWILAGARSQPVVLAFEDLLWADPTSLDLLEALAEKGAQAPLLILATARPEFRPPWSPRSHHSVIALKPLDRADIARMVGELASRQALSQEVVAGVSERTGGVPLFVEEVTLLLLERGAAASLQAIPPTLQHSLAARLDRLGEAREVAQIGAVLGRDFTYALLSAVGRIDDPDLQSALDRLADADLLISEGARPQGSYRFKHALIQEAAYESRSKARARRCIGARRKSWSDSQRSRRPSRKSSPIISPGPVSTNSRSDGGAGRATRRSAAPPFRRRWPILARRSPWRTRRRDPPRRPRFQRRRRVSGSSCRTTMLRPSSGRRATRRMRPRPRSNAPALSRRRPNFPVSGFLRFMVGFSGVGFAGNSVRLGILPNAFYERRKPRDELPRPEWLTQVLAWPTCNWETWARREPNSNWRLVVARSPPARSEKSTALTLERAPELTSRSRCGCQAISRAHVS